MRDGSLTHCPEGATLQHLSKYFRKGGAKTSTSCCTSNLNPSTLIFVVFLLNFSAVLADESLTLSLPVGCEVGGNCFVQNYVDHDPSSSHRDFSCGARTYDGHDGTDFRLPSMTAMRAGVAVLAVADGKVTGVRDGEKDISIRVIGKAAIADRKCGNGVFLDIPMDGTRSIAIWPAAVSPSPRASMLNADRCSEKSGFRVRPSFHTCI